MDSTRPRSERSPALARLAARGLVALATSLSGLASAQEAPPAPVALPAAPVTRILAIGRLTPKADAASLGPILDREVRATVDLYLAGRLDQWYSREDQPGVVFILDCQDLAQARALLERLPLGRAGLMDFELIPLGPLAPLARLGRATSAPPP